MKPFLLRLLLALTLLLVACDPPGTDDDDVGTDDDDAANDDDAADDDDATDDDDSAPDDDDDSTGDDDDSTGDDDDSADDDDDSTDDDDDSAGDDDDVPSADVEILQVHINNVAYSFEGYYSQSLTELPTPLASNAVPGMVGAAFPSNGYMAGCTVAPEVLGFLRCTGMQGDFGGTAIADSRSGELIFGGSTIWMGTGSLLLPTPAQMGPASDLLPTGIIPGYVNTSVVETNGLEPTSGGQLALNQALASVLVAGWIGQDDVDAYVWLQAYTLGMYVPENADWIVLLVKDSEGAPTPPS